MRLSMGHEIKADDGKTYKIERVTRPEDTTKNTRHLMKHACIVAYVRVRLVNGTKQYGGEVRTDDSLHIYPTHAWHGDPWMMDCPYCKGKGKINYTIVGAGFEEMHEMHCIDCAGKGKVTRPRCYVLRDQKSDEENMWCRCGQSGEVGVDYYEDGQHPELKKHHYRCCACGKVTQIG